MIISIVGSGYVGLVTGTCLAEFGHTVYCIDINAQKIENLNNGIIPIYEPGLDDLIKKNISEGRLFFTTEYNVVSTSDVTFIAVGTPPGEDGSADLQYVLAVAREFGKQLTKHSIICTKSTVPVGTADKVRQTILDVLKERNVDIDFEVASNPEFLKEGSALDDFMNPDRIVIGTESEYAKTVMSAVYKKFDLDKIIFTTIKSAEMIKYAANSMLATRISFMNEIANLCDKVGANVQDVAKGIGTDTRIGPKFLNAGCGYGGSCFPKDVKALLKTGEENGLKMNVLTSVIKANDVQKHILYKKFNEIVSSSDKSFKNVAVLGTAFKPETDDMREATSLVLLDELLNDINISQINIYDPIALDNCKFILGEHEKLNYCEDIDSTILDADIIFVVTEWNEIKNMNVSVVSKLVNNKIIIDGRNCLDKDCYTEHGFEYIGIGI